MKIGKWTAKTMLVGAACLSFLSASVACADDKDGEGAVLTVSEDGKTAKLKVRGTVDKKYEKLEFDKLEVDISGSGEVELAGKVKELEIDMTGSGEVDAKELEAEEVEIELSGSGEITAWATSKFEIDASGSGEIDLYGTENVKRSTSGSVKIRHRGKK